MKTIRGLAACLLATSLAGAGPHTPLSPMVPLFHQLDLKAGPEMVRKVALPENGAWQVQFTVLLLAEIDETFNVQRWGTVWEKPGSAATGKQEFVFTPMKEAIRTQYRAWLKDNFAAAVKAGLDISVLCQVDSSGKIQEWRNSFIFDPTAKLEGYSYEEAMTRTVLEALEEAVPAGWPVEIALEGEMGRTLFQHPDAWMKIVERAKARGKLTKLRVGISANFENTHAKYVPDAKQTADMNALIRAADFVGISCYAKVSVPPKASDFTATVDRFAAEFAEIGCAIPEGKNLRFTEIGLGGGGFDKAWKLSVPTPSVEGMANAAFFGTDELAQNPWTVEANRVFRRQWHRAALDFLATQPARWPVTSAYIWSFGSWDVHGFKQPAFRDEEIVKMLREHNAKPGLRK